MGQYLEYRKWGYERIDGMVKSADRQTSIDRFSRPDSDKFVFLLCTRAGGVGINLTAANTVIIFDSDWNPQNDLQATARCHRIGQKSHVKIYRLITRHSYESAMFQSANLKLGLDRAVLQTMAVTTTADGPSQNKSQLSSKEIESLLKHGAYALFNENADQEAAQFVSDPIEKILERAQTIKYEEGVKGESSTFSKAAFVATHSDTEIGVNDADFWEKIGMADQARDNLSNAAEFYCSVRKLFL